MIAELETLDRFAAVSLGEMVSEAALLARVDRKYIVPRRQLETILSGVDERTRVLEINGARGFSYESVYFDTTDLLSFRMAAQPRRRRFKLRTRAYLDTDAAFLEMKTRGTRGRTVKERSEYDLARRTVLTDEARGEVAAAFDAIGVDIRRADDLQPTLITRYRRTTLLAPDAAARATVDTRLRWDTPGGAGFALPDVAIVETKSPAAASDVDRLLWRAGHRPVSVSKYATGLAALRPDLPRNRWDRLLRGVFAQAHRTTTHTRTEEPPCAAA